MLFVQSEPFSQTPCNSVFHPHHPPARQHGEFDAFKEAAAFEAPSQTKEEFSGNDTSRHPKVFKLGPKLGYQ